MKTCFAIVLSILPVIAASQIYIVGDLSRDLPVIPGQVYRGQITVANSGDSPQGIKVYQTDYSFQADGSNLYGKPGVLKRSNADWISFSPQQVILQPKEKMNVNFEIRVPEDSTRYGSYWSMLMIEELKDPEQPASTGQIGFHILKRYGIQLATHFNQQGVRKVAISNPSLISKDNHIFFSVDVANTGDLFLNPLVWIELYNLNGQSMGTVKSDKARLYPETSHCYRFGLDHLQSGTYKGIVVVDCGNDDLYGSNYTLKIE